MNADSCPTIGVSPFDPDEIYVAYTQADRAGTPMAPQPVDAEIYFLRASWVSGTAVANLGPFQVNTDNPYVPPPPWVDERDQFFPRMVVDWSGGIHLTWCDRRGPESGFDTHNLTDIYYAQSRDRGASFLAGPLSSSSQSRLVSDQRITEYPSDPSFGPLRRGARFFGDYNGASSASIIIDSDGQMGTVLYAVWTDNRSRGNGQPLDNTDVFVAPINPQSLALSIPGGGGGPCPASACLVLGPCPTSGNVVLRFDLLAAIQGAQPNAGRIYGIGSSSTGSWQGFNNRTLLDPNSVAPFPVTPPMPTPDLVVPLTAFYVPTTDFWFSGWLGFPVTGVLNAQAAATHFVTIPRQAFCTLGLGAVYHFAFVVLGPGSSGQGSSFVNFVSNTVTLLVQ
jgi:hypothetical protein